MYLLCDFKQIHLLPPPEAGARLVEIDPVHRHPEMRRMFAEEGQLHFDLFAELCSELLGLTDIGSNDIFCIFVVLEVP